EFAGDGGYMASASSGKLTVTAGDLYIWPYVRSGKKGTNHLLKAYVRSLPDYVIQPGKSITFKVNGSVIGSSAVAADGWASATWAIPAGEATGAHTAAAEFAGDAWYKAVTATTSFNVVP
ncbi:MAG: Ig-like domain-containing protein, partial [Armatimonadetes bacterium]|nr:Ig-like domain-containing protein [Armatimonadota bacterium]